jgi:arginine transport system substrate-binding protein
MGKTLKMLFLSLSLLLMGSCTKSCSKNTTPPEKKSVLRIGTNATFPPFETVNAKGQLEGFDIDLGRLIGQRLNMEVQFREMEFDALILGLQKEQIDIILSGLSITQSRLKEIIMVPYYGEPLKNLNLLFWKQVPPKSDTVDDIRAFATAKGQQISVQAGHFLEGFLKEIKMPLKTLSGPPEQILDLKYQKSLAAALDEKNAATLARDHADLVRLTLPLPPENWDMGQGVGIKKSRTELVSQIEAVITKMKEDGTMKSLEEKWLKGTGE